MKNLNNNTVKKLFKNLYKLKPNELNYEITKNIVEHLNNKAPKDVCITITCTKKHLPDYDEKIIEKMIRNGGI